MLRISRVGWAFVALGVGMGDISAQGQLFLEDHESFAVGPLNGQGGWTANSLYKVADLSSSFAGLQTRAVGIAGISTSGTTVEARLDFAPVASFGRLGFDVVHLNNPNMFIPSFHTFTVLGTDGVTEFVQAKIRIDVTGAVTVLQSNFVDSAITQPLAVPLFGAVKGSSVHHVDFEIPGDGSLRIFIDGTLRYANTTINFMESGGQCGQGPISGLVMEIFTVSPAETFYIDNVRLDPMTQTFFNCPPSCPADLNSDGAVDGADLGLLLGGWGACPP